MSIMHIAGGILIGFLVGRVFSMFSLKQIKGKKYVFSAAGIVGSLSCDLMFKYLYENELVSEFFYRQTTIIFEMVVGALAICYIVNKFGKEEKIDL
jgi:uncharacterized membrane protein YeaQ/YmgE (transglycosylase-associated protein family)